MIFAPALGSSISRLSGASLFSDKCAGAIVIDLVVPQRLPQMRLVDRDHVVETFSPNRTDDTLAIGILPWASPSRFDFLDAHSFDGVRELFAVDRVAVVKQTARRFIERKRFANLLRGPRGRRMRCDADMQNPPVAVSHQDEPIQQAKGDCRHGEEVARDNPGGVVLQECSPRFRSGLAPFWHIPGHD